ncbi:MAG: UDP-2,4-diacetamido-2,4,6-trideoxy-beta-L-altropyranose hydrolase [Pseudomonas sp.]|uniref:UDP-2,4-diacetamido-2,4, 6-trideoxy-beta-L-altropyranose hydrolase n=1 Tax=Pseudomonas abieticivorans TaxID=2931382 RepID=UPI0020C0373A|nr:UDP-2,4-diacetamido-2,4,6-trideoxy-beta-L-altropyranose hydrolase [Pseudomonas sp. PIA16]MDE1164321.1 UDP-2,4-diacetamido-2,4,6-trideoxy-beta-L-altropyranose hydrolase [Pseudomonas sp.]
MKVLIRADASQAIGSGHVARCLTLARALRQSGAAVAFACRELPGHCIATLQAQGWPTYCLPSHYPEEGSGADIEAPLPWQADIGALQQRLPAGAAFDWIIVDHYGLDAQWQRAAGQWSARVAVIDDLANRPHAAQLLLDQNYNASADRYAPWLEPGCQALLGPHFALIREEFNTGAILIREQADRVLVNFGGMDAAGQTLKAMLALAPLQQLSVDFIAGNGNPDWAQLQALAVGRPAWRLQAHSQQFGQLMAQADLFVGAGGGTSWERAALGLPTLCLAVAHNQQANAERLAAAGVQVYLGPCDTVSAEQLRQAIVSLLQDPAARRALATHSRQLVDGQGARRVAATLLAACS